MKKLNLVRTIILAGSLLLQLSTLCFQSRGAAGDVDLSFDPGSGVNGRVNAIVVQPDGKVIIGGEFTTVKGLARSKVARLNVDGSGDSSFDAGTELEAWGYVRAVALQSDGKVLVGHGYGITRLNSDGSLDNSFNPGAAVTGPVYSIVVQSDGKVLIGGSSYFYTMIGTNFSYGIARLNANGSLDHSFNPGTGIGPPPDESDSWVASIALQSDGKVLIGGVFYSVNDTSRVGIARLDSNGSLDGTFDPGTGAIILGGYAAVNSVAVQSDGKVLIGGYFTSVNGTIRDGIARLNANGSLDNSYDPGTGAYAVTSVALQSDGKELICGNFGSVNGTSRNRIARLNSNGSLDATFDPGTGVDWPVFSMALQSNGKVLIGGNFGAVNGTNRNNMARLNADGGLDADFQPGKELDSYIFSVALQPDGKVLIGGVYTFINGANRYGRARLNADGSLDSTFISDIFNPDLTAFSSPVCPPGYECFDYDAVATAVAVQPDGKILVGGYSVHRECDLNEGGCHDYYGYFVARHNSDGSRDTSFVPALGNPYGGESVQALALQPNGKVVVAGYFGSIKGTNRNGIARLNADGSLDNSFNPGTGAHNVSSVALQADGKVLIGGGFYTVNGTSRQGIARLNADGSLDNSFNPGTGAYEVSSVALQPDGKVLIGGGFTIVNGTNRNRIARLNANGSLDITFNPGAGANGRVRSLALQPDGKVLIGGDFSTVNGEARPHVARLHGDSIVVPSLNIARLNAFVIVSWPVTGLNFQLQEATDIAPPNSWSPVAQPAVTNAGQISVTVPAIAGPKFFRLKSQ